MSEPGTLVKVEAFRMELSRLMDTAELKPIMICRNGKLKSVLISAPQFESVAPALYSRDGMPPQFKLVPIQEYMRWVNSQRTRKTG